MESNLFIFIVNKADLIIYYSGYKVSLALTESKIFC